MLKRSQNDASRGRTQHRLSGDKAILAMNLIDRSEEASRPPVAGYHGASSMPLFGLPLVSVIIVNYNYGRFLKDATQSVISQSYPNIQLIIVDDASNDDSSVVLEEISRNHSQVKIIRREENGGQSVATRTGFEASSGDYVVFLDADDILFPNFVETHVFVHLSLRIPVGLTSADMLQGSRERAVTGTLQYFSDYIRSGEGRLSELTRRVDLCAREFWGRPVLDDDICSAVRWVAPTCNRWVWAPMSGNCFRRDAVAFYIDNDRLARLRTATDAYLIRGIAALTGSILIDRPLSVYRVHGDNVFTQMPHLNGMLNYNPERSGEADYKPRCFAMDHLVANAVVLKRHFSSHFTFLRALKALDSAWPRIPSPIRGCRSYAGAQITRHFGPLAKAIGYGPLVWYSLRLGISPWRLLLSLCGSVWPFRKPESKY
jgi:glycosyltransferase involved in cell wall biosynthesis